MIVKYFLYFLLINSFLSWVHTILLPSLTRWTLVWVNSGSWWWTGRPGVLRFMGSQRVRHDWATELNWTEYSIMYMYHNFFLHSSVDAHLGCFHVLAIVIVLQWTLGYMHLSQFLFSLGICLVVRLLGHRIVLFLLFKGLSCIFMHLYPSTISPAVSFDYNTSCWFGELHYACWALCSTGLHTDTVPHTAIYPIPSMN